MEMTDWTVFRPVPNFDYRQIKKGARLEPIRMRRLAPFRIGPGGLDTRINLRQTYCYHSPDGFEWGYNGSGPADLALNVLALLLYPPEAWRLHQAYKQEVIARIPDEGGVIRMEDLERWIRAYWAKEEDRR